MSESVVLGATSLAALTESGRRAFSETCDPAAYVERPASADALHAIADWDANAGQGGAVAALVAPPGLGKTFLLRVVERHLNRTGFAGGTPAAGVRALYLPYAGLGPTDLAIWVHGLLGRACPALPDEEASIAALVDIGADGGAPLTLLLDDADSMPPETVQAFSRRLSSAGPSLRLLLALNPDSKGSRVLASLHGLAPREVRYVKPLSAAETGDYLRARMRWAGFPEEVVARVDEGEAHRVHALSNGIPRAIHAIAADRLDTGTAVHDKQALDGKRRREDWMGRPIEDDLEI